MTLENSGDGTISLEDAAMMMVQTDSVEEQPDPQEDADPAPETELEAEEVNEDTVDDTTDEDEDDDATEDDGDDADLEDVYLIDGEEVTASELMEWRQNGLRQSDYTKKTQEAAEQRQALQQELTAFNAEKMRVTQELQQQQAQLKDALATFAVQSMQEPNWQEAARTMEPKAFQTLQADWAAHQQKSAQAREVYQSLQQQQAQQAQARELSVLVEKRPEWGTPDTFNAAAAEMSKTASEFGFSADDFNGISDHRMFLVLDALVHARASAVKVDGEKAKTTKRVVKAAKRVPAGSKPSKNQAKQKQHRAKMDRVKQTGSLRDAAAAILVD